MELKHTVFLSYARKDQAKGKQLYEKLSKEGFKPWMDVKDILPGEKWDKAIKNALKEADFILICLSKNSINKRGYIQREIRIALDNWNEKLEEDIYLIPVLLEDCEIPNSVSDFQAVKLYKKDGWKRLVEALKVGIDRFEAKN